MNQNPEEPKYGDVDRAVMTAKVWSGCWRMLPFLIELGILVFIVIEILKIAGILK